MLVILISYTSPLTPFREAVPMLTSVSMYSTNYLALVQLRILSVPINPTAKSIINNNDLAVNLASSKANNVTIRRYVLFTKK